MTRLRERREAAGLSQAQVAEAMVEAGFSNFYPQTVLKIEKGTRVLKYDEGRALVAILGDAPEGGDATAYGERFREARKSLGLSQAALADAVSHVVDGWSQSTVWAIETGRRNLRLDEAEAVSRALNVPIDVLLVGGSVKAIEAFAAGRESGLAEARAALKALGGPR